MLPTTKTRFLYLLFNMTTPMYECLISKKTSLKPIWFMRQAGRYLPEYRELRAKAGSFLNMAYNPDFAAEVTLQPIRRYGMDAAIIFSDILVIPHALGQHLEFVPGEGPKLDAIKDAGGLGRLNYCKFQSTLNPVYEALQKTKVGLQAEGHHGTALIGFCGAPWTVACMARKPKPCEAPRIPQLRRCTRRPSRGGRG